jgi:acetyltransferase-like isoleucine patch superfamily enzyme
MGAAHYFATSDAGLARSVRRARRAVLNLTLPAPRVVVRPILGAVLAARVGSEFVRRVLVCEPLFKAHCARYGRRVRTGPFLHWVSGQGDIVLGDDIVIDGKCHFLFAARFVDRPALIVGDHTYIGHDCQFTIGRRITIGRHCLIAAHARLFDSDGHSTDPAARLAGLPPPEESARPIVVGDNVWVGTGALILKGVTIGDASVVAAHAVVTRDVPPGVVVAGNPARIVKHLTDPRQGRGTTNGQALTRAFPLLESIDGPS